MGTLCGFIPREDFLGKTRRAPEGLTRCVHCVVAFFGRSFWANLEVPPRVNSLGALCGCIPLEVFLVKRRRAPEGSTR